MVEKNILFEEKVEQYIQDNKLSPETAEKFRAQMHDYNYVPTIFEGAA